MFDISRYSKFIPDKDNILLITDEEYFEDGAIDITNRLIEFISTVYGPETLEENLLFISDTLGGAGTSREVIRKYFIKDFYLDHLKIYKKRPIYWQFNSGKENGVKGLFYLHRYEENLLGRLKTDYLSKLNQVYNARIEQREIQKQTSSNPRDIAKFEKEIQKINRQLKELREFDEKIGHLSLKKIQLDLDDGVIVNYTKLQCDPDTNEKYTILSKGVKEL